MLERLINLDHALSVLNKDLTVLFIVSIIFLLIYLLIRTEDKDLVQILGIFSACIRYVFFNDGGEYSTSARRN